MFIKRAILENFRCYRRRTEVPVSRFTTFIGKNDVGKSTILEALDIFLEGGVIKVESSDASVGGDARNVQIGVVFGDVPPQLDLDRGAQTTLGAEYLLNADGDLEIYKTFDLSGQRPKLPQIHARAIHPILGGIDNLLQKSVTDLREIVRERGLENKCNQTENPSMRQAIYESVDDLNLTEQDVPLGEQGGKAVWTALQKSLPIFALFRSDRPSTDQDAEVQDPMKVAIQQALQEQSDELEGVVTEVQKSVEETANRTLEQLRKTYPELASTLTPVFRKLPWQNLFKLDLESDSGIPVNKRGSGVRRLILISFFQAEANRRQAERGGSVIYGIEEPETSQHPDSQETLIKSLRDLAESGSQVLVTTHVPALAGLAPTECLRLIETDPESNEVVVHSESDDMVERIATTLGVLPDPVDKPGARVAVLVEGPTDVDALMNFAQVLSEAGAIDPIDFDRVFIATAGGSTLKGWVERRYLDSLGLPQVYIIDSDRTAAELPLAASTQRHFDELNGRANCTAFITRKREIENYLHPECVAEVTENKVTMDNCDLDFDDVSSIFSERLSEASRASRWRLAPTDRDGNLIPIGKPKSIITAYIFRSMTVEQIGERAAYQDPVTGDDKHEILEWLEAIRQYL